MRWAERLARARPRGANNHVLLGDAYLLAGNRNAAREAWRHALELEPGHANAQRRLRGG